jgi:hypothetical protein
VTFVCKPIPHLPENAASWNPRTRCCIHAAMTATGYRAGEVAVPRLGQA